MVPHVTVLRPDGAQGPSVFQSEDVYVNIFKRLAAICPTALSQEHWGHLTTASRAGHRSWHLLSASPPGTQHRGTGGLRPRRAVSGALWGPPDFPQGPASRLGRVLTHSAAVACEKHSTGTGVVSHFW